MTDTAPTLTNQVGQVNRGGMMALGQKMGPCSNNIVLGGIASSVDDILPVFTFEADTLIMVAGFEVIVATTNAITASLGLGLGTEFLGESATNGAVGTKFVGTGAQHNVLIDVSVDATMDLAVSADAGAAGEVRVFAVIADIEDFTGA